MNSQTVIRLLKRFKGRDLRSVAGNWSAFRRTMRLPIDDLVEELNGPNGKRRFISAVSKALRKRVISDRDVGELDLLYLISYSKSRTWSVYRMEGVTEKRKLPFKSPEQFQKQLEKNLDDYRFKHVVITSMRDEAVWIYVNITDNKKKPFSVANGVYVVHYFNTDYICIANLKASFRQYVCQALLAALRYNIMTLQELEGRCVKSLMDIVLHKDNQELGNSPPIDNRFPVSSKGKALDSDPEEFHHRIKQENGHEKRRCKEFLENRFGSGDQPTLEKVTFTLETNFHGGNHVPSEINSTVVRCKVKFAGPNVLEGLKNLAAAGVADIPMKDHLSRIKSLARNKFRFVPRVNCTQP